MDHETPDEVTASDQDVQELSVVGTLQVAVDACPDDGRAWERLGIQQHLERQTSQALASLETATALTPLSTNGQLALANCYADQGFKESARAMYLYLVETHEFSSRQIPEVVRGLAGLGEYRRALMLCREAVRRDPECDQALYGMAFYMAKCGAPAEVVLSVLHRVVELAPDVVVYRIALATTHQRLGQVDAAMQVLAPFTPDHLSELCCAGCVRKMAKLFAAAGDEERHTACLSRLEALKLL